MLKHVVVPLDGSQLAQSALDYALNLLCDGGKITLVSVLQAPDVPIYDFYPVTVTSQVKNYDTNFSEALIRAQEYLKRLAENIAEKHPFEVGMEVEVGDAATMIIELAETIHADAVVMSTHGRSGLSKWLFGSVTQKVLAAGSVPVFVIPAQVSEESKASEESKKQPV